jgi:hypothetical protein
MPRRIHLSITIGDVDPENRYRLENEDALIDATVIVPERAIGDTPTIAAHHALYVLSRDLAAAPDAAEKLTSLKELVGQLQDLRDHPLRLGAEPAIDVDEQKVEPEYADRNEPAPVG